MICCMAGEQKLDEGKITLLLCASFLSGPLEIYIVTFTLDLHNITLSVKFG